MTVDLSNIEHLLLTLAGAVITACVPVVSAWLIAHLKVAKNSALSTDLDNAVTAGARLAIDGLAKVAEEHPTVDIHDKAIAQGVEYVAKAAPEAVKKLELTPAHIGAMVAGEVAKALNQPTKTTKGVS